MNPFRAMLKWWKDYRDLPKKLALAKQQESKAFVEIRTGIESGELHAGTMAACLDEITINVKKKDTEFKPKENKP